MTSVIFHDTKNKNFFLFYFFFLLDAVVAGERESWQLAPKLSHNVSGGQGHISKYAYFEIGFTS